ncbi:TPA: hypothetical protein ACKP22_000052 [Pseudomonas putida]
MRVSEPLNFRVSPPICHLEPPTLVGSRDHTGYPKNEGRSWYEYAYVFGQSNGNLQVSVPTTYLDVGDRVIVSAYSGWQVKLPALVIQQSHKTEGKALINFPAIMMLSCQGTSALFTYRIERTPCVLAISNSRCVRMSSRIKEVDDIRTPGLTRPRVLTETGGKRKFFIAREALDPKGTVDIYYYDAYDAEMKPQVIENIAVRSQGDFSEDITDWYKNRKSPQGWFAYSLKVDKKARVFSQMREYNNW